MSINDDQPNIFLDFLLNQETFKILSEFKYIFNGLSSLKGIWGIGQSGE